MTKRKLVPRMEEPFVIVSLRMPEAILAYVDRTAGKQLRSRSDILRTLIVDALRHQGIVQTIAEMDAAEATA